MSKDDAPIVLGWLTSPHGLKGWMKIQSHTRPNIDIFKYDHWLVSDDNGWKKIKLENSRSQGKGLIVKLQGCDDRNQAEAFGKREIAISAEQLETLATNEYYWSDLIGLRVKSQQGFDFGQVDSLVETGSNDVLVVKGEKERLIPYISPDVIKRIDLDAAIIEVDWDPDF